MGHGNHQLDVAGALAAHFLLRNLDATTVADNALVTYALVFAAGTLVILGWAEDALAEQTVALGLVGAVVYGLRLGNLAERALQYLLGRSQSDGYLGEITLYLGIFLESHIYFFVCCYVKSYLFNRE